MLPPSEWQWKVNSKHIANDTNRRNCGFSGAHAAQNVQNSWTNGTSFGCWLAPKTIPIVQNCAIWAVVWPQAPSWNYPFLAVFGACVCMRTQIQVFCFKSGLNRCRIIGQNAALVAWHKKTCFSTLRWNPWDDLPTIFVWMCTMAPHLYSRVHQICTVSEWAVS